MCSDLLIRLGIVLALPLLLAGCHDRPRSLLPGVPGVGEPGGSIPVTVGQVQVGDMEQTVSVTGSLVALQDVQVSAKSTGKVMSVTAHEGDVIISSSFWYNSTPATSKPMPSRRKRTSSRMRRNCKRPT